MILTKADGDARGGAALSVREVTGKPIVLVGVGEKLDALEPFDAERMAGRILGMGDVVALVEQVQKQVDVDEAQKLAKKVAKGKGFDLVDLKSQLEQLQKMGGVASLMDKLPQAAMKGGAVAPDQGDKDVRRQIAIINSMTRKERRNPAILDGSRRRRIAAGAGVQVQDVNRLMKQFMEMQKMMKSFGGREAQTHDAGLQGRHAAGVSRPVRGHAGFASRRDAAELAKAFRRGFAGAVRFCSKPACPTIYRFHQVTDLRRIRALFWPAGTAVSARGHRYLQGSMTW